MTDDIEGKIPKFIRRMMPTASEAELRAATATFDEYMAVVWEIFERIEREQQKSDSPEFGVCGRVGNTNQNI